MGSYYDQSDGLAEHFGIESRLTRGRKRSKMHKEHEEFYAGQYRLMQAHKLLRLYEEAHGRKARTVEEMEEWVARQKGPDWTHPIKPDPEDFEAVQKDTYGNIE